MVKLEQNLLLSAERGLGPCAGSRVFGYMWVGPGAGGSQKGLVSALPTAGFLDGAYPCSPTTGAGSVLSMHLGEQQREEAGRGPGGWAVQVWKNCWSM